MSDLRTLSWQHLTPSASTYVVGVLSEELRGLVTSVAREGPAQILVTSRAPSSELGNFDGIVAINAQGCSESMLRCAGFDYVRRFAVVPGLHDARWFLPLDTAAVAAGGFGLYTPYRTVARLKRAAAIVAARVRTPIWRDKIVVGLRLAPPIEVSIAKQFPGVWTRLAFATGTAGRPPKTTMSILGVGGRPLAFAKVAATAVGARLLQREAEALELLPEIAQRVTHVAPRLLFEGPIDGAYVTIQSSLPGTPAGTRITPAHTRFRDAMTYGESRPASASGFVQRLRLRSAAVQDDSCGAALEEANAELDGLMLPPVVSHGDFAPWNLRVHKGEVSAFDWEYYERDGLPLLDEANHLLRVGFLLQSWSPRRAHNEVMRFVASRDSSLAPNQARAIMIAHVVDVIVRGREEGMPDEDHLFAGYKALLPLLRTSTSERVAA